MKEARSVLMIILILLFMLVGVGVAISRIAKKEVAEGVVKTKEERGFLERIFLPGDDAQDIQVTPTPSENSMVIVNESSDSDTSVTHETSTGSTIRTFSYNNSVTGTPRVTRALQKGAPVMTDVPTTIPSTGSPTVVVLSSLAGLAGGVYMRKRS